MWPVSDRATPPTEGLTGNGETFGRRFRRGRETLAELGRGRETLAELVIQVRPGLPLMWPVSDRATPPTEGLPRNGETFGRRFRRGRETLAELGRGRETLAELVIQVRPGLPLMWPVSDRATPPTEGLTGNGETFGRRFRRGRETLAELGRGKPGLLLYSSASRASLAASQPWFAARISHRLRSIVSLQHIA